MIGSVGAVAEDAASLEPGLLYQYLRDAPFPLRPLVRWPELRSHLFAAGLSVGHEESVARSPSRLRIRNAEPNVMSDGLWVAVLDDRVRFIHESDRQAVRRPLDDIGLRSVTLVAEKGTELLARWLERQAADEFRAAYASTIGRLTGQGSDFPVLLHVGPGGESSIEPDRFLVDVVLGVDRS